MLFKRPINCSVPVFFTADPHFGHKKIIEYLERPFADAEEMNEALIAHWNSIVVDPDSIVFLLGDFVLGDHSIIPGLLKRLNGHIHLIAGCHDEETITDHGHLFASVSQILTIEFPLEVGEQKQGDNPSTQTITMCHYSMRVWPRSHYGSWHIFGHCHGRLKGWGKSFDVGVDAQGFQPLPLEDIMQIMAECPKNPDLITS